MTQPTTENGPIVVRYTLRYKLLHIVAAASAFLVPGFLFSLSFVPALNRYSTGYRWGALVALVLFVPIAGRSMQSTLRSPLTFSSAGIHLRPHGILPWSIFSSAILVRFAGESHLGFRIRTDGRKELDARALRELDSQPPYFMAGLAFAVPVAGVTPSKESLVRAVENASGLPVQHSQSDISLEPTRYA